jgi:hypothetical protein
MASSPTSPAPYPSNGNKKEGTFQEPWATKHPKPADSALPTGIVDRYGRPMQVYQDPAYAPPYDPLTRGNLEARANVISREIPIIHVNTGWSPNALREGTVEHIHGIFEQSTQIVDTLVLTDSRVQSALSARAGGLLGRPLSFKLPKKFRKSDIGKECLRAWRKHWPHMATEATLFELLMLRILLGFAQAQLLWDMSGKYAKPYVSMWNSRYTYFDWIVRRYINITLDGPDVVDPGDGHHILYAPHGIYRGWMRGKAFSIINWWLSRQYALRDMSRYSERHGFPIVKGISPMGADILDINAFREQLNVLGQESVVQLPQSADQSIGKYDVEYLEAEAANYEVFGQLIDHCNSEITLAIMGQNLAGGSEVKEGSFAAARVHADVRQQILEQDARSLSEMIYQQIARPFAALNFGDPELAPRCVWDVGPVEDKTSSSRVAMQIAMTLNYLRTGGYQVRDPGKIFRQFGLDLGRIKRVDPVQIEAKLAQATGELSEKNDQDAEGDE